MSDRPPIYCCIPIEFIQPWDQNAAIRQVKELALGNMVMMQGTFHVGNSEEDRQFWKVQFPELAAQVDATPGFPERPVHGMTVLFDLPIDFHEEQLRLCRELGLAVMCFLPARLHLDEADYARLSAAGDGVVLSEMIMGENTSMLGGVVPLERLRALAAMPVVSHAESSTLAATVPGATLFDNPESLDFRAIHDWFVARFRAASASLRARWSGLHSAIESTTQMRLALEAGLDLPIFELVPHEPLRGLASVRGAAKAYGKAQWGVHTAMGYYREPGDQWLPERLRIADDLFFIGGATLFSECNMPLRKWGSSCGFFTIAASPPIREGEVECREFDDPLCARAREILGEFYRFTQFHHRPAAGPRVRMGYLLGHLDGWSGGHSDRMWMVDHPGFLAPEALQTWRHFDDAFASEPWYEAPRKYYWQADPAKPLRHGTPPGGQVDIVPLEAPPEVLSGYGSLAFLGWNTMTAEAYDRLVGYVASGGTLFLAVPHLDTRTRADQPPAYLHDGDVRALCGVRILGAGDDVDEVYFAEQGSCPACRFPQGTLYLEDAPLARLELCGARVLAHPRGKPELPVLLEHRVGRGFVYLLATREFPGARLDALVTDILRTLAESAQGEIAVEGRDVYYAVYDGAMPSGLPFALAYLVNHDIYGQPAYPILQVRGRRIPMRAGRELRFAWLCEELVIAPYDRFVQVTDLRREGEAWIVELEADPPAPGAPADAERLLQVEILDGTVAEVSLDGQLLKLETGPEGDHAVRAPLSGAHRLRLVAGGQG